MERGFEKGFVCLWALGDRFSQGSEVAIQIYSSVCLFPSIFKRKRKTKQNKIHSILQR